MIKAVLLDVDGVIIQGHEGLFSDRLAKKQHIPIDDVIKFFKQDYKQCATGKADIKESLKKYLDLWKWDGTVEDLLTFWYEDGNASQEVLNEITKLRNRGINVYIASDHTQFRANDIMKRMGMDQYFDGSFFSSEVGFMKEDLGYYDIVMKKLGLDANEVMFWDDQQGNVETALEAGIQAKLYDDLTRFQSELNSI